MKIHKKIGSKERLFEMFENVNNVNIKESNNVNIKESNEVGTDSGIFQMLLAYVSKNRIMAEEFQVGELTVQIQANPTTWDDIPYQSPSHMQPEEGGYPENIKGEISNIIIWDREDNEYTLSSDALQRLNQNVQFDGNVLEDITQKAINGGGEDEYSRADFTRKDSMENEGVIKEMIGDSKSDTSGNDLKSYLEKNYDQGKKTIEIQNVVAAAQKFNVDQKVAERLATQIIKDYNTPNRTITYSYDEKGNWIPKGHEDKMLALRPLEQPLGSGNWKVGLVLIEDDGDINIIKIVDTWEEGKNELHASIT